MKQQGWASLIRLEVLPFLLGNLILSLSLSLPFSWISVCVALSDCGDHRSNGTSNRKPGESCDVDFMQWRQGGAEAHTADCRRPPGPFPGIFGRRWCVRYCTPWRRSTVRGGERELSLCRCSSRPRYRSPRQGLHAHGGVDQRRRWVVRLPPKWFCAASLVILGTWCSGAGRCRRCRHCARFCRCRCRCRCGGLKVGPRQERPMIMLRRRNRLPCCFLCHSQRRCGSSWSGRRKRLSPCWSGIPSAARPAECLKTPCPKVVRPVSVLSSGVEA